MTPQGMLWSACLLVAACAAAAVSAGAADQDVYTNDFHVVLRPESGGGIAAAVQVARDTGLRLIRPHLGGQLEFHFVHDSVPTAHPEPSAGHARTIADHPSVSRVAQQRGFRRRKRGLGPATPTGSGTTPTPAASGPAEPSDPLFGRQWFLKNRGQVGGKPGLDLNVLPAWQAGFTGRGVVTAIMDDGLDYVHPDIADNYHAEASYDFSSNDPYPYPRYTDDWFNSHGTRCAGEVAAKRNNGICGSGVAPGSRVASLRMLDQPYINDIIEAAAMSYKRDIVDIYSASWGPTDNGQTVDGPRNETMRALLEGVNRGRRGKGNIFVWASGDGGAADDCNCDGYTASMWTISINSATNDGHTAIYDESCSSTLASALSNGKSSGKLSDGVATTDLYGKCTLRHSGTSAAAPQAAGVFALALEANPSLTWRDMQHLVVLTSKRSHLADRGGKHEWLLNGAGLEFNHLFGYGILDAGEMVQLAKLWRRVPSRFHCVAGAVKKPRSFNVRNGTIEVAIETDACASNNQRQVNFIEHVQAFVTLKASRRGDVTMLLTSPSNTTSMILSKRPHDADSTRGFDTWPFMTTHMWGESPRGRWTLRVALDATEATSHGILVEWRLVVHGTQAAPYTALAGEFASAKLAVVKRAHSRRTDL